MQQRLPDDVYRWGVMTSLSPVVFFVLSVPIAVLSTTLAVACWLLAVPFGLLAARRWEPPEAKKYLG
jgi:hypothetical protein